MSGFQRNIYTTAPDYHTTPREQPGALSLRDWAILENESQPAQQPSIGAPPTRSRPILGSQSDIRRRRPRRRASSSLPAYEQDLARRNAPVTATITSGSGSSRSSSPDSGGLERARATEEGMPRRRLNSFDYVIEKEKELAALEGEAESASLCPSSLEEERRTYALEL